MCPTTCCVHNNERGSAVAAEAVADHAAGGLAHLLAILEVAGLEAVAGEREDVGHRVVLAGAGGLGEGGSDVELANSASQAFGVGAVGERFVIDVGEELGIARSAIQLSINGVMCNEYPIRRSESSKVLIARCFRLESTWLSMSSVRPVASQNARRV